MISLSLPLDKIIQKIALKWLDVFLDLAGHVMLRFTANILIAVLPCLAYTGDKEGMNIHIHVYVYVHVYVHIHIHIHVHVYVYVYVYIHIHVHAYFCFLNLHVNSQKY